MEGGDIVDKKQVQEAMREWNTGTVHRRHRIECRCGGWQPPICYLCKGTGMTWCKYAPLEKEVTLGYRCPECGTTLEPACDKCGRYDDP